MEDYSEWITQDILPVSPQLHWQILRVYVVKKLCGMSQVEYVKIMQIFIYQFSKGGLPWNHEIFSENITLYIKRLLF